MKLRENILKKLYIIIGIIIYFLVLIFYYDIKFDIFNKKYEVINISDKNEKIENNKILESKVTSQIITISQNNFSGFGIALNKKSGGNFTISIKDIESNELIKKWKIQDSELYKKDKQYFYFDKINDSIGKKYEILFEYDIINENTALPNIIKDIEKSKINKLLINNIESGDELLEMQLLYERTNIVILYNILKISIFVILTLLVIFILNIKKVKVEKIFLITIPILSMLFVIIVPIGRNHDEVSHYKRAVEVANGVFITPVKEVKSGDPKGEWLNRVYQDIEIDPVNGNYTDLYNSLKVKFSDNFNNEKAFNPVFGAAQYSPIVYIPSAIGIIISNNIFDNPMIGLYIARVFNLIVTLTLLYCSLKLLPKFKNLFYIIMLNPSFLTSITAISADGLTIGTSFLIIAFILNICYNENKKCKIKDFIIILLLGVLLALLKTGYIPLIFLVFLIPKEKIDCNFKIVMLLKCIIVIAAIITNIFWYMQTKEYSTIYQDNVSLSSLNMKNIKQNPLEGIKSLIYTNIYSIDSKIPELYGSTFLGWFNVSPGIITWLPLLLITIMCLISKDNNIKIKNKDNLAFIIISAVIFGVIFGIFFLNSIYKEYLIYGIQSRYYFIILPMLLIILKNFLENKIRIDINFNELKFYGIIGIVSLMPAYIEVIFKHLA